MESCNPLGRPFGHKHPLSQQQAPSITINLLSGILNSGEPLRHESHSMSATTQSACTRCTRHLHRIAFKTHGGLRGAHIATRRQYSVQNSTANGRPFRMAVIGSGPAGFYTSYKVLSKIENGTVDMYEHLPVPYGLVRFGVAPDHPEVKVCELRLALTAFARV